MPRQAIKPVPLVALSPNQASEATGYVLKELRPPLRAGEIRAVRIGTKTRIAVSELERWLSGQAPASRTSEGVPTHV